MRRAVGTVDEALTQYTYTTWGGVATAIDPRGNTTTYAYTTRHQIQTVTPPIGGTTTYGYDTLDNQVSMTDGNAHTWTTAYSTSRFPTAATDPLNNKVTYAYDANGNRTSMTDAKSQMTNQMTTFAYDSRDRLTKVTDPLNGSTSYLYDAVGNLLKITNARNFATNFAYDAANRLTQVTDALTQVTTYGYDAVGNRVSMKDRKGTTFTSTYDQVNRLTQVSAVGSLTVSYTYDANENPLTMVDSTGTTSYAYDSLDRGAATTYADGKSVQVAYDKTGNRVSLTYPGGLNTLSYTYDAANRLSSITQGTLSWSFSYDAAGNRTQLNQPNGRVTTYAYLANNWLQTITHAPFATISYTYDANGNRISQGDPSGTSNFTYDALNRLTQAVYPGTYGTWSWAYDPVGNRTTQTVNPGGGVTTYAYDANNRLTNAAAVVYTYDANGNLTGTTAGQSYTYDVLNRMTRATGVGGTPWATYTYNGAGLKIQRAGSDGITTRYYYDGFRPIWETDGIGTMTAELDRDIFGNLLSRREASGMRRYYHPDGLGSTIGLTDEAGNVAASMLYDAWGQVRSSTGAGVGKYQFTGAELDSASGLYHMGARFYDPSVGRWLSEDAVQSTFEPISLNLYAYVANNPLGIIDPAGTRPLECGGGDCGSVSGSTYADLNRERQNIVKKILELANGPVDAVGRYLKELYAWLETIDPVKAAQLTGWLAAITGTLSTIATFSGNVPLGIALGGFAIGFTALNMYFADVQYRRGQIRPMDYYFAQAWNVASIGLGGAGMAAKSFRGTVSLMDGLYGAAAVIGRVFGWGGVAISYSTP